MTKLYNIDSNHIDQSLVKEAASCLASDGTVVIPTETVYGLGGNGLSPIAITKIYSAKDRPVDNPLILHIHSLEQLTDIADPPQAVYDLAKRFWPGPLTMIMPKKDIVPLETSGGLDTVAVRMPNHSVALAIIRESGLPIAAPSANLSGRPSPTTAEHVSHDLWGRVDLIIDSGATGVGLESTVIDLTVSPFTILRPGDVTYRDLASVLGEDQVRYSDTKSDEGDNSRDISDSIKDDFEQIEKTPRPDSGAPPKAPGMKYLHYSPSADLLLINNSDRIIDAAKRYREQGYSVGLLVSDEMYSRLSEGLSSCENDLPLYSLGSEKCLSTIASRLYYGLREMDEEEVNIILCPTFTEQGIGKAIMNRLEKAAQDIITF